MGGPRPDVDHAVPVRERGLPEGRPRIQVVGDAEGVVHQQIEPSRFALDPLEQRRDLLVRAVVAGDGTPVPPAARSLPSSPQAPGQLRVAGARGEVRLSCLGCATRVIRCAGIRSTPPPAGGTRGKSNDWKDSRRRDAQGEGTRRGRAGLGRDHVVGLPLPQVAGPEHVAPGLAERLGRPGAFPFTRGVRAEMYRARPWTVRQLAGFGSARDTNRRYRLLLDQGATGINGVFDYPSLRAFDADDSRAVPDVGRGGVAVDTLDDFEDLFAGVPLERVSVSLVSSQPIGAVPHLAMFLRAAERRGFARGVLTGTSQNDFLMETAVTIARAALPPAASFRLECDLAEFVVRQLPRWNPVSVAGYNYREAGADAVLESLHINGYDEAVSIPTEHAALTALRTQYVLLYETGVAGSADPLGGGYLVEHLTDAIEARAREVLARIEAMGGIVAATEQAWVHRELSAVLREDQAEHPPFGSYLGCERHDVVRIHGSSGTSGKPTLYAISRGDWSYIADVMAQGFYTCGVRPSDTVQLATVFSLFMGGWGALLAAERIGASAFPLGAGEAERQLELMYRVGSTVLVTTPTYALHMLETARQLGYDPHASPLRLGVFVGEPGSGIPGTRRALEEGWGITVRDCDDVRDDPVGDQRRVRGGSRRPPPQ